MCQKEERGSTFVVIARSFLKLHTFATGHNFMMFFLKSGVKRREAIRNIVSSAYNETDLLLRIDTYVSSEDECETGKYMYIP